MPVNYEMRGNYVMRDGEAVALITPNGGIEFPDDEARKFANVVTKFLSSVGRYDRETGIAVFNVEGADAPVVSAENFDGEEEVNSDRLGGETFEKSAPDNVPVLVPAKGAALSSVRNLIDVMQPHVPDDPCPPFSPMYGEETEEVKAWLARHHDLVENARKVYSFVGSLENFSN